jgi:hypothetical protein
MQENCRICLENEGKVMMSLNSERDGRTIAGILEFLSGIKVNFGEIGDEKQYFDEFSISDTTKRQFS